MSDPKWLKQFLGRTMGLDTAPLIYYIEEHPQYLPLVAPVFEAAERGEIELITSALTLTEVLIHPLRKGDFELARKYSHILLNAPHVRAIAVSTLIASDAARLRAQHGYTVPDAIQIATAIAGGATAFLTNDEKLFGLPEFEVLALKRLIE